MGSSPIGLVTQPAENKAVTKSDKPGSKSQNQKLASSLFLESENDADLRLFVERWPNLSVELGQAIVRMVR